jgi:hypothetical protein
MLPPEGARLRWSGARAVQLVSNGDGEITIDANGRRWRFAETARPVLELLVSGRDLTVEELGASGGLDDDRLRTFVKELIANGLVVLC